MSLYVCMFVGVGVGVWGEVIFVCVCVCVCVCVKMEEATLLHYFGCCSLCV